jgi:hypothetical protein
MSPQLNPKQIPQTIVARSPRTLCFCVLNCCFWCSLSAAFFWPRFRTFHSVTATSEYDDMMQQTDTNAASSSFSSYEKRPMIPQPRIGRSSSLHAAPKAPTATLSGTLNSLYSALLKRQGLIPAPRVGRSDPFLHPIRPYSSDSAADHRVLSMLAANSELSANAATSPLPVCFCSSAYAARSAR